MYRVFNEKYLKLKARQAIKICLHFSSIFSTRIYYIQSHMVILSFVYIKMTSCVP